MVFQDGQRTMTTTMQLEEMRRNYAARPLDLPDLDANPFAQFDHWMREAIETQVIEPNAMTLATADASGRPAVRTVLLKGFDERGFVFYSNYESAKARDLASNSKVALLFPWLALERQVSATGSAQKFGRRIAEVFSFPATRKPDWRLGFTAERGYIDAGAA